MLLHALTELVANVMDHAHLDPQGKTVRIRAHLAGDGSVTLDVIDDGGWKMPVLTRQRGRGLALIRDRVGRLEIIRSDNGTTARVRHTLTRSAGLLQRSGATAHADPERFDVWAEGGPEPVVGVLGPLDGTTVKDVSPFLSLALTEAAERVTVDLTRVGLLASAGVDALFGLTDRAKALGLEVSLIAPYGSPAQHVLDLVGLPYRGAPT